MQTISYLWPGGGYNTDAYYYRFSKFFAENGIKLSINKCATFVDHYEFLGFTFSKGGLSLTQDGLKPYKTYSPPMT